MPSDEVSTKPTFEALMERINELGARLFAELADLRKGQDELRKGQDELRKEQTQLRVDMNAASEK